MASEFLCTNQGQKRGKLFKGGNYSRADTKQGNTVSISFLGFQYGVSIRVKIISVQKTEMPRTERLRHIGDWNPYLYTIEITHGKIHWHIKRRYNHFMRLHKAIVFSRNRNLDDPDANDTKTQGIPEAKIKVGKS